MISVHSPICLQTSMQLKWLALLATFVLLATNVLVAAQTQALRVVTFNIRFATGSLQTGEKPWFDLFCFITATRCRQRLLIDQLKQIRDAAPAGAITVFGLQEVLNNQLNDIKNSLGSDWAHVGVGRDDGKSDGEFAPIIYRKDAVRLLYSETKWLSPTPDVVSLGWGAGSRRIVTIAVFESLTTGKRFIHANTHLDNASSQARSEGIKVVLARIKAVQSLWGPLGVSLTGDFNSQPGGDAYQTLVNAGYVEDLYNMARSDQRVGPYGNTFTGFVSTTPTVRMDFIWLGPKGANRFAVNRYEILSNLVDGIYISDHRAVVGDATLL